MSSFVFADLSNSIDFHVITNEFRRKYKPSRTNVCSFFVGKNKGDISIGDEYVWIRWGKDSLELYKDTKGYYINKFGKRIYGIIRCHDSQLDKLVSGISLNSFGKSSFGRDLMYLRKLR